MRNLLIVAAIGALGFSGWYYVHQSKAQALARRAAAAEETRRATAHGAARVTVDANAPRTPTSAPVERLTPAAQIVEEPRYRCDGRIYCSQMTSCEEAQWFLDNCPGVKMDNHGKGDGVPCERQWCGTR